MRIEFILKDLNNLWHPCSPWLFSYSPSLYPYLWCHLWLCSSHRHNNVHIKATGYHITAKAGLVPIHSSYIMLIYTLNFLIKNCYSSLQPSHRNL